MSSAAWLLCDTPASLSGALPKLQSAPFLFLDCEGWEIGTDEGKLSVISLGTPNAENVYLIDTLSLSQSDIQPILDLLQDENKPKYVWDGRMDYLELKASLNTSLAGTIDLTLVDILSRNTRGENEDERMKRFATRMHPFSQIRMLQTSGVHKLISLRDACSNREHDINLDGITPVPFDRKPNFRDFMNRPLHKSLQAYAASDIEMIARLHTQFNERGYLSNRSQLLSQTKRFFETNQDKVPLRDMSGKFRSGLLPVEVLDQGSYASITCMHCKRLVSSESIVYKTVKRVRQSTGSCKVCYILEIRRKLEQNRDEQWDRMMDSYDWGSDDYA